MQMDEIMKNSIEEHKLMEWYRKEYEAIIIASNPQTDQSTLVELSKLYSFYVLRCVAENPNTPSWLIDELSEYKDTNIRCSVAKNKNISVETLFKLSEDIVPEVRDIAKRNTKTESKEYKLLVQIHQVIDI